MTVEIVDMICQTAVLIAAIVGGTIIIKSFLD